MDADGMSYCDHGYATEERVVDGWRLTFAQGCSTCKGTEVKLPFYLPGDRPKPQGPACPTFRNINGGGPA